MAWILTGTLILASGTLLGCASSQNQVTDVQQVSLRLQGNWLLRSYRPNVALELPLQGLLGAQVNQMQVRVDGAQLTATGPGFHVVRSYQIQEVVDQTATLVVSEPSGVSVRVWVEFRDPILTFRPLDAPWSGVGTLERM